MYPLTPTKKKIPEKTDFFAGFVQLGYTFGDTMFDGITWKEGNKWYFVPRGETKVFEIEPQALSLAFTFTWMVDDEE